MLIKAVTLRKILTVLDRAGMTKVSTDSTAKFFSDSIVIDTNCCDDDESLLQETCVSTVEIQNLFEAIDHSVFNNTETFSLTITQNSWIVKDADRGSRMVLDTCENQSQDLSLFAKNLHKNKLVISSSISETVLRGIASTYLMSIQNGFSVLSLSEAKPSRLCSSSKFLGVSDKIGSFDTYACDSLQAMQVSTDCNYIQWTDTHISSVHIPTQVLRSLLCLLGKFSISRHINGKLSVYKLIDSDTYQVELVFEDSGKCAPSYAFYWTFTNADCETFEKVVKTVSAIEPVYHKSLRSRLGLATTFKKFFKGKNIPEFIVDEHDINGDEKARFSTLRFRKAVGQDSANSLKDFEFCAPRTLEAVENEKELIINSHVFMRTLVIFHKALQVENIYLSIPTDTSGYVSSWGYVGNVDMNVTIHTKLETP